MPPFSELRPVIERLRALGSYLTVSANNSGELRFQVESDVAEVQTYFTNLKHPEFGTGGWYLLVSILTTYAQSTASQPQRQNGQGQSCSSFTVCAST